MSIRDRFWSKVLKGGGCWEWQAFKRGGYGTFSIGKKIYAAHRVAYELEVGWIPPRMFVRHKCDNPSCVRPDHLEIGTQKDNCRDRDARQRNGRAKLTRAQAEEIRELNGTGLTQSELARKFGVTQSNIHCILARKSWV